jgi:hypothetical protein
MSFYCLSVHATQIYVQGVPRVFENTVGRVNKYLETGGGHFEHYLYLSVLQLSGAHRLFDHPAEVNV